MMQSVSVRWLKRHSNVHMAFMGISSVRSRHSFVRHHCHRTVHAHYIHPPTQQQQKQAVVVRANNARCTSNENFLASDRVIVMMIASKRILRFSSSDMSTCTKPSSWTLKNVNQRSVVVLPARIKYWYGALCHTATTCTLLADANIWGSM